MIFVTQADIRKLFDTEIIGLLPEMGLAQEDVAWPNARFSPKADKGYLRVWQIPGQTSQATLGGDCSILMVGVYQVSIFQPKDTGIGEAERWAKIILDAFPLGRRLPVCDQWVLIRQAYTGTAFEDEGRLMLPVSLAYNCYVPQKQNAATAGR